MSPSSGPELTEIIKEAAEGIKGFIVCEGQICMFMGEVCSGVNSVKEEETLNLLQSFLLTPGKTKKGCDSPTNSVRLSLELTNDTKKKRFSFQREKQAQI